MSGAFDWKGAAVPFRAGETVASALMRSGVRDFGPFCGIGQCQGCLVRVDGRVTEACLALCRAGALVQPLEARDAG